VKTVITELSLTTEQGSSPFAVIAEQGDECAWSMPSILSASNLDWSAYTLGVMERRSEEAWVLGAWANWFADLEMSNPDARRITLQSLEQTTPGVVVRKPKTTHTRLPVGALTSRWCQDRLFDRAQMIGAQIADALARGGQLHWDSAIEIEGYDALAGDWIVEHQPSPGKMAAMGLAVINAIDTGQADALKMTWANASTVLGGRYPYGIAIVRNARTIEVLREGCLIGDRFAAPIALAVATVKAQWHANQNDISLGAGTDHDSA
jgi:hypothetical protein